MFYLHLLVELINSKKYWKVPEKLVPVLKGVIQVKFQYPLLTANSILLGRETTILEKYLKNEKVAIKVVKIYCKIQKCCLRKPEDNI